MHKWEIGKIYKTRGDKEVKFIAYRDGGDFSVCPNTLFPLIFLGKDGSIGYRTMSGRVNASDNIDRNDIIMEDSCHGKTVEIDGKTYVLQLKD